ncbi:NADP-dependent oxidoreductase [Nonomuraea sp. KM90]|uniref:NADP-dependent oxidoreductase n=1 Tax=Nonomuraea sp. KM90 TaxID=3457428 RepID=UPI003FCCD21E
MSSTMRAIVQDAFGGPEVLRLAEVPRPVPLPTEVLVRVHAAGVNPVDWKTRGGYGMAGVLGEPPFILGWDVSGVVEEAGFGVTIFEPGDEVFGMPWFPRQAGAYAEYVTAPARQFARKPRTVGHEAAAGTPLAALTAWQSLIDTARVGSGQRVLIHAAAGGVGHLAVQIARHAGAYVIGTATAAKHDWLRSLGADEVIDYTTTRFEDAVGDVDVVLDLVGDERDHTSTRSLRVLRPGGLLVAVPSGVAPELIDRAREQGVRATGILVEPDGAALARIAELIDKGELWVEVEELFPLAEAAEAHRRGEQGRNRGKIVLSVA